MTLPQRTLHRVRACVLLALPLSLASAQDQWNRFRGPDGSGVAPDSKPLPAELDPERNLLWKRDLPLGHSSPCIWEDRIFVTGHEDGNLATICIDRNSGEIIWRRDVAAGAAERLHPIHDAAAPTPTTDGERVFVYFGSFGLLAYDFAGEEVWRRELPTPKNTFGTAASPIVAGDHLVFVHDSNDESFVEAIQPETGATVWKTARPGFKSGWSTPAVWRRDGALELLVYGIYDFEHTNAILALRPGAEGAETRIVWQYPHGVPECPSALVYDGRVYLVKNGGLATCLDAKTGTLLYQERLDSRGPCYASPVAGDGKIFTASARGVVTIFEAGDSLKVLSRNDLGERIMATPALVDGRVYVRTEASLYAFGASER